MGLSNFEDILTDPEFYDTIRVSLIYALGCAFASYAIGLGIATLLNKEIRFRGLFRAVLLIPWAIPTVVAASNWSYLLNDQYGPINTWLMNWGIIDSPILFLVDTSPGAVYRGAGGHVEILSVHGAVAAGGHAEHRPQHL